MAADNDEGTGKHRKELRHRVQSFIRRPGDSSDDAEEYETFIPEDEEEEFIDEETAELAEEVMLYTSMERELLCETILGYLWWSLIFALPPMIWFYPLNELEISGYEAFVITIMTPVFTGIGAVLDFCRSLHGLAILRTLSLVGVASFQAPTTLTRLVLLAFGCGGAMLWFCGIVWSKKPSERSLCFWGLILGFFLMLAARALYISVNPVWSDNSSNKLCLILGIVATLDRVYTGYAKAATTESTPPSSSKDARVSGPGWVLVSLGFGALMFISHSVFSEVSIVSRWGVSGYPNVGASPNPWGAGVPLALALGVTLSTSSWTSSGAWSLVGVSGAAALYKAPGFGSYAGGLVLAVYVMSIWPAMIDRLFCRPSARTLALANLTYVILTLGSVWVVAYNFVPGGEYTRERTDVLLGVAMAFVGLAMMTRCKPDENELYSKSKKEDLPCNEEKPSCSEVSKGRRFNNVAFPIVKANKFAFYSSHVKPAMFFLVLVTAGIMAFRHQNLNKKPPVKEDPRVFSAMIWTVHFGYDNKGWPSFERAAQMINDTGVDVVGFLESDCSKSYLGSHDLPGWFEERLGMHADFGPSTRDHTWGATLLSKYPIVSSQHHLLPSPEGELAPAVSATINITGSLVDFVVVHMGNDRDDLDRQLQAQELARIMDESPNPVVFLGYVTSAPGSRDYNVLLKKGRVKDIDSTDRHRWCEYIMYRGLTRLGYARISHGGLSDTEVQMARFRLPADGERYKDNDKMTTSPRAVPRNLHFTDRFGSYYAGHYYGEHHYHMSTPKYFLPE